VASWRLVQTPEYEQAVASLAQSTRAALADVYQILAQGPFPGESPLPVLPYAAIPSAYTVPVGEEGLVVCLVLPATRTIGLVGLIWMAET
jgi:hypothetical protein